MINKRGLGIFVLAFLLLSLVSAQVQTLPPQLRGSCMEIPQTCSTCTFINITAIKLPNSTTLPINELMTKNGFIFTYDFCNTELQGTYIATTCGNPDGEDVCVDFDFPVTPTGTELKTGESILYLLAAVVVFALFSISLYFNITIPYRNGENDDGDIITITKLKYIKIGLILITHGFLVWFLNILIGITNNFLFLQQSFVFIGFLFNLLNWLAFPLFVVIFIWFLFEIVRDINLWHLIDEFGSVKKR